MKKAKRFLSVLLTLCMVLGLLPTSVFASNQNMPFSDVDASDWFYDSVQYVYENSMMSGTGEDTFSPDTTTTRGMIVTILHSMEGKPAAKGQTFGDVAADQYYANAVAWASANGIVSGYSNGNFGPNDPITREQMAAILYKYAIYKDRDVSAGEDTNILSYDDALEISEYAVPAIQWAVADGLMSGTSASTLSPTGSATRAQVATILMQFCSKSADQTYTVTFEYNYGEEGTYLTETVAAGETVDFPEKPERDGYLFKGWFTKANGGEKFAFDTPITDDLTLYAKWSKRGNGNSAIDLESASILREAVDATGVALKSGDVLTVSVLPEGAAYSVQWLAGGAEVGTGASYTVSPLDVGKTITAQVTGTGSYEGTVTTAATGTVVAEVNLNEADPDTAPVVIASDAAYKDAEGKEVTIGENSTVTLEVEADETAVVPEKASTAVENELFVEYGIAAEDQEEVTVNYVTVDADLTLTTTTTIENETTGETEVTTEETEIHPVGATTLTLSKENLGIPADEDISTYTFFAHHTNVDGKDEVVPGEVVTVNGEQRIRFTLNGLSRIYIGNVPPLTVTFDTAGGSEIPAQKVKLGGYAVDVEPPVKEGWLFAGWDHDIQTENIIKDITVTARWIQGTTAADEQLSGAWFQDGEATTDPENVTQAMANGVVTLTLDSAAAYAANLSYVLSVAPMDGAVKMATATTAEAAMEAGEEDYEDAAAVDITAAVTDESGIVKTSNTNRYVKWIAEDGTALGLQSARLVVRTLNSAPGNYDTQTHVETEPVDRGLGQVEFYLTDGTDSNGNAIPDFAGVINGYLNSNSDGYYLHLYSSFYESFWEDGEEYTGNNYTGVKVVITPFAGESFSGTPTVSAYYWDEDSTEDVDYTDSVAAKLENGNIVLSCAKPAITSSYVELYMDVTLGDKTQSFSLDIDNYNNSDDRTSLSTESWTEAVEAIANGTNRVYYRGTENVTLNSALTLEPDQGLYFNKDASMTIGSGGVLTLKGDDLDAAYLSIRGGSLTVADGGILTTNSQNSEQNRYYNSDVNVEQGVTVADGGTLRVPEYGYMRVYNGQGGFALEQGGQVSNACVLYFDRDADSTVPNVLSGTVSNSNKLEFNDGLTITATGTVANSSGSRFEVYGGLIVEEGGQLTSDGRRVTLSGRTENYGTITMNSGTLNMWNTGYSVYNTGTISVASEATMSIQGTVLVNTGALTGSGTLYTDEQNDASSYDNGIEYVEIDESTDRAPNNYSRYQFVRDPAETVDVIYFVGELSNQNGGTSTLTERN